MIKMIGPIVTGVALVLIMLQVLACTTVVDDNVPVDPPFIIPGTSEQVQP